jgi:heptaprenyl diphosphate synthase
VGRYIANIVEHVCESELRQNSGTFRPDIGFGEYHRRIMGKTAGLFAVACYTGAFESGADGRTVRRLRKIGHNIGVGFQMIDDILDYRRGRSKTGKPAGTDLRQGVVNLPLLCAIRRDDGTLRRLFRPPVRKGKAKKIMQLVEELGGIEDARRTAAAFTDKALTSIELLPDLPARRQLRTLAEALLKRDY